MLPFLKKTKAMQNISSETVHLVFTSKFACHYLYLLCINFINYFYSFTTVSPTTRTSYWTIGSSVKTISGTNFVGKCTWLIYSIFLTYCVTFFSQRYEHFLIAASCIFKLTLIISSHVLPLLNWVLKSRSDAYHIIIFFYNISVIEFIYFWFCISRITLYSYLW